MKPTERDDFSALLTQALAFYGQTLSPFALGVWWQACEPFAMEQVSRALTAHAMDPDRGQFPPRPADLVRKLAGTQTDRSLVAWGKAFEAAQRCGAYASVVFDDPAIHAAITDIGGWVTFCRAPTAELPHTQRRFCEAHRAYSGRPDIAYPPRLVGEHETSNRLVGRAVAAPMLIGDPDRARDVERNGAVGSRTAITAADALPALARVVKGIEA